VADDAGGHVVWRFGIDTAQLADSDPLREAVAVYQRSLRAVMERLCGGAERTGEALHAVAARYREADGEFADRLTALAELPWADDGGGPAGGR
jgi:hypothetical protein